MKKSLLLPLALSLFCLTALGQTRKMELFEVAAASDLIVSGKVTELGSKTYVITISSVVSGASDEKDITVERFQNTKTGKRWGKYALGEDVLVFLVKNGTGYRIVGENGEGEKLVLGEDVYLDTRGGGLKNTFGYHAVTPSLNIYAEKVNLKNLETALRDVKSCLKIEYTESKTAEGGPNASMYSIKVCEDKTIDELRLRSPMHEQIIATSEKFRR